MTTSWTPPTSIAQYAEPGAELHHISWNDVDNYNGHMPVKTSKDLLHIARSPKLDVTMKTYYLSLSSFNFIDLPEIISGIELRLAANRRGRITDETIQLMLNNEPIGKNQASLDLSIHKIYGGETDLWETTITPDDIQNNIFGVLVRFQSHPHWPHKDPVFLDALEVRIH
jgi:hypothetical protein